MRALPKIKMEQIKELHRHLFREEMDFDDKYHYISIDDGYFLMRRKNRCSHEIGNDKQLSKNEIYKNNFFKKNAAKKQAKKSLTFEKSKRIFDVFLYYLNYLRERFLASTGYHFWGQKVPLLGAKVPLLGARVPLLGGVS